MSGYPAGAEFNPDAPYNEDYDTNNCSYCNEPCEGMYCDDDCKKADYADN